MAKPANECIFCGGRPLSHEHVWDKWMKQYIPRDLPTTETYSAIVHQTHKESKAYSQSGDPHSRRLRVVCKRCNSGWMSRLQERAKPFLIPLIKGDSTTLDVDTQRIVSAWAALKVTVAEYHEKNRVTITPDNRAHLMETNEAPPNWKIWIGRYGRGEWSGHWMHNALPVYPKENVPDFPTGGIPPPNTQTTSFVAGQLYIHAMSSALPRAVEMFQFVGSGSAKIACIWPAATEIISWPLPILTDGEAHAISNEFFNRALQSTGRDSI